MGKEGLGLYMGKPLFLHPRKSHNPYHSFENEEMQVVLVARQSRIQRYGHLSYLFSKLPVKLLQWQESCALHL